MADSGTVLDLGHSGSSRLKYHRRLHQKEAILLAIRQNCLLFIVFDHAIVYALRDDTLFKAGLLSRYEMNNPAP